MRFLYAILMAMAALAKGGLQLAWTPFQWCLDRLGGGGGGPAAPRSMLDLPDAEEAKDAKAEARDQQRVADIMLDHPATQVKMWLGATALQRESIPLSKLSPEQQVWLQMLPEEKHQLLLDAPDRKIFDALTGKEGAIPGVLSYGIEPERVGPLTERISSFRNQAAERRMAVH